MAPDRMRDRLVGSEGHLRDEAAEMMPVPAWISQLINVRLPRSGL
jgi:hypothetical protein